VPQKALLNDKRIVAFISHAGGSSGIEVLYYGKLFIGLPDAGDQVGNAYRLERLQVGISQRHTPDHKQMIELIEQAISPDN